MTPRRDHLRRLIPFDWLQNHNSNYIITNANEVEHKMSSGIEYLKQVVPAMLKVPYWRLKGLLGNNDGTRPYAKKIDLRRTFMGGEGTYDAGQWAEMTGDMKRASTLLEDSVHVKFLEQYRAIGEKIFVRTNFEQTPYFENAVQCVQFWGHYFGQKTPEGILAQARAFATMYERLKNGDPSEVRFPSEEDHAPPRSLPHVRETLTPDVFQVVDGHHRLAIAWVLGERKRKVIVVPPPMATPLQSLVLKASQTDGKRKLDQPITSPEFDGSWRLVRPCEDRFSMMLSFLAKRDHDFSRLSVVDLCCSYGWFVSQFLKRGCHAIGVDMNQISLKIGRIAYGLDAAQLVESDLISFLDTCGQTYDVVLLLSFLQHFALNRQNKSPEEILQGVDAITGSYLFLDAGQSHEQSRCSLAEWNEEFIVKFIKQHTSFTQVIPLGTDSARTLFVCVRS
jgi:hypothetical protein